MEINKLQCCTRKLLTLYIKGQVQEAKSQNEKRSSSKSRELPYAVNSFYDLYFDATQTQRRLYA